MVSAIVLVAFGLWLLYHGLHMRMENREVKTLSNVDTYLMFLGLTLLNPVTVAYFTTLILGLTAGQTASSLEAVLFIFGAFLASLSWQTLLAVLSGSAHKRLSPKCQFLTFTLGDCIVIILGILILFGIPI